MQSNVLLGKRHKSVVPPEIEIPYGSKSPAFSLPEHSYAQALTPREHTPLSAEGVLLSEAPNHPIVIGALQAVARNKYQLPYLWMILIVPSPWRDPIHCPQAFGRR